jgi:hypothetical protein
VGIGKAFLLSHGSLLERYSPISQSQGPMMLLILSAFVGLIGLMGCAAVRVARAMTGRPGTEARATRLNLSTEAQATRTEAQATSTGWPSGRKPKPPLPPLRKVGRRKTAARAASRPAGRAQRPRPLNRGPPPAWTALLLDFHLSRPQGVGPLSQVGAWEFLRLDVHSSCDLAGAQAQPCVAKVHRRLDIKPSSRSAAVFTGPVRPRSA